MICFCSSITRVVSLWIFIKEICQDQRDTTWNIFWSLCSKYFTISESCNLLKLLFSCVMVALCSITDAQKSKIRNIYLPVLKRFSLQIEAECLFLKFRGMNNRKSFFFLIFISYMKFMLYVWDSYWHEQIFF